MKLFPNLWNLRQNMGLLKVQLLEALLSPLILHLIPDDEVETLREIVSNLSHPHITVLAYLLSFLSQISIENPIKGGIANISIYMTSLFYFYFCVDCWEIFGPCLLRPPPDNEPKNYKEISKFVVGKLIEHREKIFLGISRKALDTGYRTLLFSLSFINPISGRHSENHFATNHHHHDESNKTHTSLHPLNNDPHCKELAAVIHKRLEESAVIARKVELLKSQLENKYKSKKHSSISVNNPNTNIDNKNSETSPNHPTTDNNTPNNTPTPAEKQSS